MVNRSSGIGKVSRDQNESPFNRDSELRRSTGSIKGKKVEMSSPSTQLKQNSTKSTNEVDSGQTVHTLIKGFQSKIINGNTKRNSNGSSEGYSYQSDSYKTPGYVNESAIERAKGTSTKRKLSLRHKKGKLSADDAKYNILQSLGMSPFAANENRSEEKSFSYFDTQSLFFALLNAATLKALYVDGSSYTKKLTGASAASRTATSRKKLKSGEFDKGTGRFMSRAESMIDEGDDKSNELVLNCPYFRNEIAEPEETESSPNGEPSTKHARDIAKLISMFNRNRSFENLRNNSYDHDKRHSRSRREFDSSEQDILLEEVKEDSSFLIWDEPNVSGKRIFDFEHIDRGAMYYKEYFSTRDHINLFGIDEKYGPMAISIVREVIPRMAVLGHSSNENTEKNKKYQYRIIFRTCELYALRISVLEHSIPSTSRHGSSRPLPIKDVLECCFPEVQLTCLRHCLAGPKIPEQLIKLDEQQLSLKYKIGLIYCKAGQKTEEEMYNNENGGSEFLEFCSVIADQVALKGFQGYRAQLDNKNDSTGAHSLYTTFHGREIMFHVSTELPYTGHDRQQLLRKRHIGNDIVTVIFQQEGSEPFTPQMMRSHFQHVFIIVRVENPHTEFTRYDVAVSRSRDVPYFGPPVPPNKFNKNAAFREFLLSKLINAENAAHKSDKFTHMARRTRYEYLKDLATNHVSTQTIEPSNKFAFPFKSKSKGKTHPPVNSEIWLRGGMMWYVKFDFEHDGNGSPAFLSISTKAIVFVEQSTQEVLLSIPCKNVLGWRPTSHTLKLFYDNGKMAYFSLVDDDLNELPYVLNRLKAVTPGCETQDLSLRRNNDGQLGFHVFYEGLVAEVEPYGLAWQSGLRKGSRLLEISGHVVQSMSHERMIVMLKRPGAVRIVVLPPAPDGQPRNYKAVRNLRRYSSMTSVYSMSAATLAGVGDSSSIYSSNEKLTGSYSESSPQQETTPSFPKHSLPVSNLLENKRQHSSTSGTSVISDTSSCDIPPHNQSNNALLDRKKHLGANEHRLSLERLITSRSASDIHSGSSSKQKRSNLGPSESVEQELGEIERQLTDTRKSIDAKFYRSLANSPNIFFGHSKSPSDNISEPLDEGSVQAEEEVFSNEVNQSNHEKPLRNAFTRRASDVPRYPVVNEYLDILLTRENTSKKVEETSFKATLSLDVKRGQVEVQTETRNRRSTRNSLQQAFENTRVLPNQESSGFVPVDSKKIPVKPPRQMFTKSGHINTDIDSSIAKTTFKLSDSDEMHSLDYQGNYSDSSALSRTKSQENSNSEKDSDPGRKGNIVRTKVREAKEIISERKSANSPISFKHDLAKKSHSIDQPNIKKANEIKVIRTQRHSLGSKKFFPSESFDVIRNKSPRSSQFIPDSVAPITLSKSLNTSPKISHRNNALIRAVDAAAKNKAGKRYFENASNPKSIPQSPRQIELRNTSNSVGRSPDDHKLDDSLFETFAKLDAAFEFKPNTDALSREEKLREEKSREEKRRKKRSNRRRSRNFEPPSSDSSEDIDLDQKRRGSRTPRRHTPDDSSPRSVPKSEAEESLEAAITEFQIELSTMPEKSRSNSINSTISLTGNCFPVPHETSSPSHTPRDEQKGVPFAKISSHAHQATRAYDENPPKVPVRTSRPQSLIDHQKLKQKRNDWSITSNSVSKSNVNTKTDSQSITPFRPRVRSETKVLLTSLRPWSPPLLSKPDTSTAIKEAVRGCSSITVASKVAAFDCGEVGTSTSPKNDRKPIRKPNRVDQCKKEASNAESNSDNLQQSTKEHTTKSNAKPKVPNLDLEHIEVAEEVCEEIVQLEDQLSPLPRIPVTPNRGGVHSLPTRSKKRRATVAEKVMTEKSASASCIPLAVRGLDLAASKSTGNVPPWNKDDLHVMITVMESELEQEREENERLALELIRSKEEKERLLEQSKQAASQLRKFTSLFLDASPQELEKAKQRYSDAR